MINKYKNSTNNHFPYKLKFKLPEHASKNVLGRYQPILNWMDFSREYEIYIDIKRIIKYCNAQKRLGWEVTFDQLFSQVVSHEIIHHILTTQIGQDENDKFDNLFGTIHPNPKFVYSGIKFENDRVTKRHNSTKHINSKKNKVGVVIKE